MQAIFSQCWHLYWPFSVRWALKSDTSKFQLLHLASL